MQFFYNPHSNLYIYFFLFCVIRFVFALLLFFVFVFSIFKTVLFFIYLSDNLDLI